ncbi:hypothetical protein NDI37_15085 [Funiculus sociatus GB2-A5]|uniref:Uncharacterized protein n=1 Tax=Funiculus sociatus GB2-A5 TaxID=2933946 RepID=A0ABV0JSY9_9CYAN|nr:MULTISPECIES: hypothetical protein [unclassified Trichocoleus]MBD1908139.1 hypothetical protein [Trichocoleus sp. FACHB-832]MBD2062030.1 hypothetical protein [Trichocoleus sp. FACHB-6]
MISQPRGDRFYFISQLRGDRSFPHSTKMAITFILSVNLEAIAFPIPQVFVSTFPVRF